MTALVPIQDVLDYLDITDIEKANVLQLLTDSAVASLENLLGGRRLEQQRQTVTLHGNDTPYLLVSEWPIVPEPAPVLQVAALDMSTARCFEDLMPETLTAEDVEFSGQRITRTDGKDFKQRQKVTVEYTSGYTAETLPSDLKHAILKLVSHAWNRRGNEGVFREKLGRNEVYFSQSEATDLNLTAVIRRHKRTSLPII